MDLSLRFAAAIPWLALGLVVAVSGLVYPGGITRNLVMGSVFVGVGAILCMASRSARRRLNFWLFSSALVVGGMLAYLAGYRFFIEGMAVFG